MESINSPLRRIQHLLFYLLLTPNLVHGLTAPLSPAPAPNKQPHPNKIKRLVSWTQIQPNAAEGPQDADQESFKAYRAVKSCAQWALASSVVDIALLTGEGLADSKVGWLNCLRTIWKASFAYNLRHVSSLYQRLYVGNDDNNKETDADIVLRIFRTMIRVWRTSALMIVVSAATNFVAALQDKIAWIGEGTLAAVLGVVTAAVYVSQRDTRDFRDESPQGAVLVRSMMLCSAALLLEVGLIPVMALVKDLTWQDTVMEYLELPTPLALAALLLSLRGAFIQCISDIVQHPRNQQDPDATPIIEVQPTSQIQLAQAQQLFYSKVKSVLQWDVLYKIVFTIATGSGLAKLVRSWAVG